MEDYISYTDTMENYNDYTEMEDYVDYTHENVLPLNHNICFSEVFCIFYLVVIIITFLVGVFGNGLVIWIAGLKMKKTVNTTWYLSLAVSDFILCVAFITFNFVRIFTNKCIFGNFMCDITFFMTTITMFNNFFLLVMISIDRCLSVVFPVWVQTHHTVTTVVVLLVWVSSGSLSTRFLFAGETHSYTILMSNFNRSFAMTILMIIFCYSVIILRRRTRRMMSVSSKSNRVMTVLIFMFFICLVPYSLSPILLRITKYNIPEVLQPALMVGVTLFTAHGFLRPVLYVFMGNNTPSTHKWSIFHRIQNAIGEEGPTTTHNTTTTTPNTTTNHETSTHV